MDFRKKQWILLISFKNCTTLRQDINNVLSHVWLFCDLTDWFCCPWDFLGKSPGVGCHLLLQGISLTQGSSLCLLHLLHWQVSWFFFFLTTEPPGNPEINYMREMGSIRNFLHFILNFSNTNLNKVTFKNCQI